MQESGFLEQSVEKLQSSSALEKIKQTIETITAVQQNLYALANNEEGEQLTLLKVGTVFQVFFIDLLASGKQPKDLTKEEWTELFHKVSQHAILDDGQEYSVFVFSMYADYIDLSALTLQKSITQEHFEAIKDLAKTIRNNTELLRNGKISEIDYIEACLWLSLEAMMKLLCSLLDLIPGTEFAQAVQSAAQLAFEYGRYVLFAKEQAILQEYIDHQRVLDEKLKFKFEAYLEEVQAQADQFRKLVDAAFSTDFHDALIQSAALARAAGVEENELLTSLEEVDDYFM